MVGQRFAVPDVVTMNKAHSSHFTLSPDERIDHVLRGWNFDGRPADHDVVVDDVYIRNVTTDIRNFGAMEPDGNSIFIFEVADLCIGHLGHLHHPLEDRHFAQIGRLDIVMVPVDGGLTLSHTAMTGIAQRLQSSILLPMHRRGAPLSSFIEMMGDKFRHRLRQSDRLYHFRPHAAAPADNSCPQGRLTWCDRRRFLISAGSVLRSPQSTDPRLPDLQ
jgi:L-ascorbate metabolism protein UlaG (beta-lactamase superfamily)